MDAIFEWLPALFLSGIAASFMGLTFMLYRRWQTKNYRYLFLISGFTFGIQVILFCVAVASNSDTDILQAISGFFSIELFIMSQAALVFFFTRAWINGLYVHVASAIIAILGFGVYPVSHTLSGAILAFSSIAFCVGAVVFVNSNVRKSRFFLTAQSLFLLGSLFHVINILWNLPCTHFMGLLFIAAAYFVMLLTASDQLVDLIVGASYTAVTDKLTGLYNKAHFFKSLRDYLQSGEAYAVVFSDIDNFKKLNDTQGHQTGDEILKLVAKQMQDVFQDVALVARYGGEEMVAVITDHKCNPAELTESFRERVESMTPSVFPATVSVGFSLFEKEVVPEEFIRQADEAMYRAKSSGKNRVVSYQAN